MNLNIAKIKTSVVLLSAFTVFLSGCQTNPFTDSGEKKITAPATSANPNSQELANAEQKAKIKAEKKLQSEIDIPFRGFDYDKKLTVIATGSCANQDMPQPIWKAVEKAQPDLFIFSGDTVYSSRKEQKPLLSQFRKMNRIEDYRNVREKVPFMVIWDDHDFGVNDGGADNGEKEAYRTGFMKYWTYLNAAIPASQKALYHSKIFGPKKQKVQVIMMDLRWDRSPLKKNVDYVYNPDSTDPTHFPRPYIANEDKDAHMISDEQWSWLEKELKKPADLRLLVSSIQMIPDDHNFEKWGLFPKEREKMFKLLAKTKAKNTIILSGDRHMSSIAKMDIPKVGTVYEMTSSGINMEAKKGNILNDKTYLYEGYPFSNFGIVRINWDKKIASLEIHGVENQVVHSTDVHF